MRNSKRAFLWLAVALFLGAGLAEAATLRVPSQFTTVNSALDAAADGDSVLVAPGTYADVETRLVGGYTMSSTAFVTSAVTLLSEAGPEATHLQMTGDGAGVWRVVLGYLVSGTINIQGFTISGAPPGDGNGGVFFSMCGEVEVNDCIVRDLDAGIYWGGGMQFFGNQEIFLRNTKVLRCLGEGAGGIDSQGGAFVIEDCEFAECANTALRVSGGIGGSLKVRRSIFRDNLGANSGSGGLSVGSTIGVLISDCFFVRNVTTDGAGAAISIGWDMGNGSRISRCVFDDNRALSVGSCAGVAWFGDGGYIENNVFYRCHQDYQALSGSAINVGNLSHPWVVVRIRNNIIMESSGSPAIVSDEDVVDQTLLECNVFWANQNGDLLYTQMGPGDRVIDPQFCGAPTGDFTLHESSPCLPEFSEGCGLVGVFGAMCDDISVESKSWGQIKGLYR